MVLPMADTEGYGLDRALQELSREAVLGQLCQIVAQVRHANADRQEPALGDDAVSLAALNWRNIVNQLARHFDGRASVKAIRPQNSFQLQAFGYTVNVYGLPSGDPQSIVWKYSGIKQGLAMSNSAMTGEGDHEILTFDDVLFEDGLTDEPALKAKHLVVVHWADRDASVVRIWAGLPRDNTRGGSPWLEVVELTGYDSGPGEALPESPDSSSDGPSGGFREGALPEVTIEWMPADQPETGSSSAADGA